METIGQIGAHSPKIRKRRIRVRQTLVDKSAALFAARGIDDVSVDEIIDAGDIAKSTFYTIFRSKNDLVAGILTPVFLSGASALEAIAQSDARSIVSEIAEIYLELWTEYKDAFVLISQLDPKYFALVMTDHEYFAAAMLDALKKIKNPDALRTGSPEIARQIVAKSAIPLLGIYQGRNDIEELFKSTLSGLLLKD